MKEDQTEPEAAEARARMAFRRQAEACRALDSPFTAWLRARLGETLDRSTELGRRVLGWRGDLSGAGDSVPLRLCEGLHGLALSGEAPALARAYAAPVPDEATWRAVTEALREREATLVEGLRSPPQTNETAQAALVWPALSEVARHVGRPLEILEVGAAAGLNLRLDRFAYRLGAGRGGARASPVRLVPEWRGRAFDGPAPEVAARAGCDLRPADLSDPAQRRRLLGYVWPDQPERLARMRAAIDIATAHPATVEEADAVDWLRARLVEPARGLARVVFSTIAWQHLPQPRRREGARLIRAGGAAGRAARLDPLRGGRAGAGRGADARGPSGRPAPPAGPGGLPRPVGRVARLPLRRDGPDAAPAVAQAGGAVCAGHSPSNTPPSVSSARTRSGSPVGAKSKRKLGSSASEMPPSMTNSGVSPWRTSSVWMKCAGM
jgi:hypothetical protein